MAYHDHEAHILAEFRKRGYRITQPRKKIIEAIATAASPKTAREIGERTHIKDASTVYRTLAELVEAGLLTEFQDRGMSYYEHVHEHHDHAVCQSCGIIEHIPCASSNKPPILTRSGWKIVSHETLYRGVCGKCVASL